MDSAANTGLYYHTCLVAPHSTGIIETKSLTFFQLSKKKKERKEKVHLEIHINFTNSDHRKLAWVNQEAKSLAPAKWMYMGVSQLHYILWFGTDWMLPDQNTSLGMETGECISKAENAPFHFLQNCVQSIILASCRYLFLKDSGRKISAYSCGMLH